MAVRRSGGQAVRGGVRPSARPPVRLGRGASSGAVANGPARVRLCAGRRHRAGVRGAGRGRARHRKVHPTAAVRGAPRARRHPHAVRLGRGVSRSGAAARGPPDARRRRRTRAGGNPARGDHAPRARPERASGVRRLDSDHLHRRARRRPGQRRPGARVCGAPHAASQGDGPRGAARGARDEGRRHRRPQDARAYRGHGALLRGRNHAGPSHPARGQEPVRLGRRDRRVRHDRRRPRARGRSGGGVPRRPHRRP